MNSSETTMKNTNNTISYLSLSRLTTIMIAGGRQSSFSYYYHVGQQHTTILTLSTMLAGSHRFLLQVDLVIDGRSSWSVQ